VSEVPREPDQAETGVGGRGLEHQLVGSVAAAVVDENRLGVAVERVHQLNQAGRQLLDHAFLVVRRNYQRVSRHETISPFPPLETQCSAGIDPIPRARLDDRTPGATGPESDLPLSRSPRLAR